MEKKNTNDIDTHSDCWKEKLTINQLFEVYTLLEAVAAVINIL